MREAAFLTLVQDPGHPNVVGLAAALQDGRFLLALAGGSLFFLFSFLNMTQRIHIDL